MQGNPGLEAGQGHRDATDEPEAEEKESKETPDKTEYDYLLNMPLDQNIHKQGVLCTLQRECYRQSKT